MTTLLLLLKFFNVLHTYRLYNCLKYHAVSKLATKTVKIRIKDSTTAKHLRQMARAVNQVWNYCNETSFIVVGKLSAQKLAKTKMAKSINDAGTTMLKTKLKYKARACQLSVREWVCCECGAIHDRDINAAVHILRNGRDALVPRNPPALAGGGRQSLRSPNETAFHYGKLDGRPA